MCLLTYLLLAKSVLLLWEQPRGSLMEHHPRFVELTGRFRLFRHHCKLWQFGGESEKALWLYSQKPWLPELDNYSVTRD